MQRLKFYCLCCLTVLSSFPVLADQPPRDPEASDFEAAKQKFKQGDFTGAATLLSSCTQANEKNNPLAHYYLGNALLRLHRTAEARKAFQNCLSRNPDEKTKEYCYQAMGLRTGTSTSGGGTAAGTASATATTSGPATASSAPNIEIKGLPKVSGNFYPDHPSSKDQPVTQSVLLKLKEHPGDSRFKAALMVTEAKAQVAHEKNKMEQAKKLIDDQFRVQRRQGELDDAYKKRVQEAEAQKTAYMKPYVDFFEKSKEILSAWETEYKNAPP